MPRNRTRAARPAALAAALLLAGCAVELDPSPPAFPGTVPAPPPAIAQPEPQGRQEVRTAMYQWFMAHGYKPFQAAALLDHARYESNYRPCAAGPGGYRYTFQWGGGRLEQLHRFARTRSCPALATQLAFSDHELRNDPKFSCFWGATTRQGAYAALRRGFGRGAC